MPECSTWNKRAKWSLHPTNEDLFVGTPDLHPTNEDQFVGTPDLGHPERGRGEGGVPVQTGGMSDR